MNPKCCRIVLTGGPGGGKTTAADLFRREIGDHIVIVPEAATILYGGGFPRSKESKVKVSIQKAIYHVQVNLEDAYAESYAGRVLLCDRGSVDGAAYWPGEPEEYFAALGSTIEQEFARYDAVIFFESAAVGNVSIEGGNPIRTESIEEALKLDKRLREIWSKHPRFSLIPHRASFFEKLNTGLAELENVIAELNHILPQKS